jgi:holo-[acyl-carrier protein] synthase
VSEYVAIRVGLDVVSADEVRASFQTHGDHYLNRVFSDAEIADCTARGVVDPARLAARFAAKEATFKALRVGDRPVPWRDVEVRRGSAGEVELLLTGRAAAIAHEAEVTQLALSLTHERGVAAAIVIAESVQSGAKE